jgi:hypothetical protein
MTKFCIYEDDLKAIEKALGLLYGNSTEKVRALEGVKRTREYYAIVGISKADVAGKLLGDSRKGSLITNDDMSDLADMMQDAYLSSGFWEDLDILGEDIKNRIVALPEGEE